MWETAVLGSSSSLSVTSTSTPPVMEQKAAL